MPSEPLMSSRWTAPAPFSLRSLLIAAGATALCCLCALWAFGGVFRKAEAIKNTKKSCECECSCGGGGDSGTTRANGEMAMCGEKRAAVAEKRGQVGGSMMEQLVPEITTHALSYLDYTSLCRLSMTNSAMRRAANDDGAWKALYHKVRVQFRPICCTQWAVRFRNGHCHTLLTCDGASEISKSAVYGR